MSALQKSVFTIEKSLNLETNKKETDPVAVDHWFRKWTVKSRRLGVNIETCLCNLMSTFELAKVKNTIWVVKFVKYGQKAFFKQSLADQGNFRSYNVNDSDISVKKRAMTIQV